MPDAAPPPGGELEARILELEQSLAWFADPRHYESVNGHEPAVMKRGISRARQRLKWAKGKVGYRDVYQHLTDAIRTATNQREHLAHLQRAVNRRDGLLRDLIEAARPFCRLDKTGWCSIEDRAGGYGCGGYGAGEPDEGDAPCNCIRKPLRAAIAAAERLLEGR
jgi:hypothetical protein